MWGRLRGWFPGFWRMLLAFGLFGLAVWPVAAWLSFDLIGREIADIDQGIRLNRETIIGRDFVNIWHGGREAAQHGAGLIYDRPAYREALLDAVGITGIYAFSYPPHMLMLATPFGLPPYLVSLAIWLIGTFALFLFGARPFLKQAGLPMWSVLLLPGAVVNFWAGHFGFLIGGLALIGWWQAKRWPMASGIAFALMSVKPHMGVLVPLVLAVRRQWTTIAWAGLATLALVLLSILAFGIEAWTTWFTSTLTFQIGLIDPGAVRNYYFMMPTVNRMILEFDRGIPVLPVQIAFGAAALALLVWAERRRASLTDLGLLSVVATPLFLPYLFNYDLVPLSLAALVWGARSPARWWSPERLAYGAAFLAPIAQVPLAKADIWVTPFVILIVLALAAWRCGRDWAEPA